MNYASVVFAGFATISVVWYFVRARKEFRGPPIIRDDEAREEAGVVAEKVQHVEDGKGEERRESVKVD